MSYVSILHAFLVRRKICALFFRLRKTMYLTVLPMSSQILSYINIFDINRKLLAQATDVKYFDKCTRELEVGTLTLNFTYFSYFFST